MLVRREHVGTATIKQEHVPQAPNHVYIVRPVVDARGPGPVVLPQPLPGTECEVPDCPNPSLSFGLCLDHGGELGLRL